MAKKAAAAAKPAAKKGGSKGSKTGGSKGGGGRKTAGTGGTASKPAMNSAGHNGDRSSENAIQQNFLQHRSLWHKAQAQLKVAQLAVKDMVAAAKADGFLKKEFEIADALAGSPKKEAKIVGEVSTRLRVARWIGHSMGKQYDLFENPPVTLAASEDEASEDGKRACMAGEPAKVPEQYAVQALSQAWLKGYDDETVRRVKSGIKPLKGSDKSAGGTPETTDSKSGAEEAWEGKDPEGDKPPAGWGPSKLPPAAQAGGGL